MLQRGGNAVDAALAAAITLTVVEPCSNGIGSDLFAILWDGRELIGLNASGRAPAAVTPARYAGMKAIPERSWEAVTIPGAVAGWAALSQRFGSLPFADLFAPAIRYARDGYAVSPVVAEQMGGRGGRASARAGVRRALHAGRTRTASRRDCSAARRWRARWSASRATHGYAFYHGELAEAMVAHAKANARCTRWRISRRTRSTG